ncbi:MAG: SDR family oxidoreductase [Thermoanaerobaculia bacterium]
MTGSREADSPRVFITGGASGLGRALAERYAEAGYRVCIGDIHEERGRETLAALSAHGVGAHFQHCDVTQAADLASAAEWLAASWGGVDVVINNAGVAACGGIGELSIADWQWIVDINVLGVVRGCQAFLPIFLRQGRGHFVNVASVAGLVHPAQMSAYCATKAAVVAISESLRIELEPDRINVSVVCPSFFRTNLTESLRSGNDEIARATHAMVDRSRTTPEEIAAIVYEGVARGDLHIVTHADGRFAWRLKRFAPVSLYLRLMRKSTQDMLLRGKPDHRRVRP